MASSGFCLLNTVGVAAAYALYSQGKQAMKNAFIQALRSGDSGDNIEPRVPKIAIVDIDVHHGNGTEQIVKNIVAGTENLPLPSSWAPVTRRTHKPWLSENDSDHVFFGSINLYGGPSFYPCSGADSDSQQVVSDQGQNQGERKPRIINIGLTPIGPAWDIKGRQRLSSNQRASLHQQAGQELRKKVESQLLPALREFKPDLLLISSGFDSHIDDMYHFLDETDYHWLTKCLCDCTSDGRVISVLEGGYSLSSPITSPKSKVKGKVKAKTFNTRGRSRQGLTEGADMGMEGGVESHDSVTEEIEDQELTVHDLLPVPTRFGVLPGDGGLVKGTLAHLSALAGRDGWVEGAKDLL